MSTTEQARAHVAPVSRKLFWAGCLVSALPVLVLVFSGVMKLVRPPVLTEGFAQLGWPERFAIPLGIVELFCTAVYLVPRTAVIGAILLTGYFGGATAAHARLGEAFFLPIVVGMLVWLGLFLRDTRIRALIPFRA